MYKLLLTMALCASLFASDTMWVEKDKQQHFAGTAAISMTAAAIARGYGSNWFESAMIGVATGIVAGVVKETYDRTNPNHHEDIEDVYADTLGAVAGSFVGASFWWEF